MITHEKFWDRIADKYASRPIKNEDAYQQTLARTRSYLSRSDRVLEVGCGTGSTALLLADAVDQIVATDISANMIAIAQGKATADGVDNVAFRTMDLQAAADPDAPFDVVMALNLLHLTEDLDGALTNLHRQVREGGLLISKTVCMAEVGRFWRLVLPVMQMLGKAPFVRFLTIPELEQAIERAGFQIIETGNYPVSPPNRYVVARKI